MSPVPSGTVQAAYRQAFVLHCFELIRLAHRDLDTTSLHNAEEPHITGELVRQARTILESPDAVHWMRFLAIHDDPPQNQPGVYGKRRRRLDVEFEVTGQQPRPRFHIEAKRLYRQDSVNEYFGDGGLLLFVTGQYAPDWPSAGMLGYIQSEDESTWHSRLAAGLAARTGKLRVCAETEGWESFAPALNRTCHQRGEVALGRIDIFHCLLTVI